MWQYIKDLFLIDEKNKPSIITIAFAIWFGFSIYWTFKFNDLPDGILYLNIILISAISGINFGTDVKDFMIERARNKYSNGNGTNNYNNEI